MGVLCGEGVLCRVGGKWGGGEESESQVALCGG